jgi:hypothetical protein
VLFIADRAFHDSLAPSRRCVRHLDPLTDAEAIRFLEQRLEEEQIPDAVPAERRVLKRYCVHRKPIKAKVFKKLTSGIQDLIDWREVLVRSFLVEHDKGWDMPNRLVPEIVLAKLPHGERRGCDALAAEHYTRHFAARRIEDRGGLGGHFVEARYEKR